MEEECDSADNPEELQRNEVTEEDDINGKDEQSEPEPIEHKNNDTAPTETDKGGKNIEEENENNSLQKEKNGNMKENLTVALKALQIKKETLQIEHLKDLPADFALIDDVQHLKNLCSDFVDSISDIFSLIKDTRECMMTINKIISHKITNEGLYSWLRNDYSKTSGIIKFNYNYYLKFLLSFLLPFLNPKDGAYL